MKKISTLLVFLIAFLSVNAETITKTYMIPDLEVTTKSGYQTITSNEMLLAGKPGEPALPYYSVQLMLPPGHEAVSISFQGVNKINMQGYYKLYPMQHSRPLSVKGEAAFTFNENVYKSVQKYPASQTGVLTTHFMNGYSYALCTFTPVEYIPLDGAVSYYTSVTITIETQLTYKAQAALSNLTSNNKVNERCLTFAQNPEKASLYATPSRSIDSYDILIITPQEYRDQIHLLSDNYQKQGLKTNIITTEYIQSNLTGIDLPEKMRNLIIQEYQASGISQVILGGDVQLVPYRGFYCQAHSSSLYEDNDIPSDLYFSGLDGNWNNNNNQLWAEPGEDDLLPDISVARMPFGNSTELSAMLNKTTKYQNNPVTAETNKHLLAGENLYYGPDTWGSDYLELLIGYHDDNGYTTTGIPATYPISKMYDEEVYWSGYDLIDAINTGYSMINHVGHANEGYVAKWSTYDITNGNFFGVNGINHSFPVFYTHGCICGAFDYSDCIAERMVTIENFASAFVGNSRYGWFNEGQTEGPSAHINREFIDALYTDSLNRIGSAHLESKIATAPWVNAPGQWEEGALRWCFYDCNVLGDAAMPIWTNLPLQVNAVYPSQIPVGTATFEVTCLNNGAPAAGITVAFIKDNLLIGRGISNSAGIAQVQLDSALTVTGAAEIILSGYNCTPTSFPMDVTVGINDLRISDIRVFPNPATDHIKVVLPSGLTNSAFVLRDLTGRTIREVSFPSSLSSEYTINTSGVQPGIYYLYSTDKNQGEAIKIIIK